MWSDKLIHQKILINGVARQPNVLIAASGLLRFARRDGNDDAANGSATFNLRAHYVSASGLLTQVI